MEIQGRKALVLGAGRSGVESAKFLSERGATVALHDKESVEEWADAIGTITYTHTFTATCTGCGVPGTTDVTWSVDFSGHLPARGNYIASITVTDLAGNTRTVGNAEIVVQT